MTAPASTVAPTTTGRSTELTDSTVTLPVPGGPNIVSVSTAAVMTCATSTAVRVRSWLRAPRGACRPIMVL